MIRKLLAAFMKPDTTKLLLAGLAVGWGLAAITTAVEELQAEADELTADIDAKRAQLAQLDAALAERVANYTDEIPGSPDHEFPNARVLDESAETPLFPSPADLDAWAAEHSGQTANVGEWVATS